jgi:predicted NAD/FAD-binding protein
MKKIAIIGTGISGLTAAYLLSKKHQVTVFEKNAMIGGHTATVDVSLDNEKYAIDTGFIVFNNRTYPNFLALLSEIGIDKQETEMSFSVHNNATGLEYNGHSLDSLFAQRRNILRPRFWMLIKEILRFNKLCKALYDEGNYQPGLTLGEFLTTHSFSDFFSEHYILPMGAAIWSSSLSQMAGFEFQFFVKFFYNHGLLNIQDRPQWYVIPKGSRSYLTPLCKPFSKDIHLNSTIEKVERTDEGITVHFEKDAPQYFDEVVLACHSDQALALLADANDDEKDILSAMPYKANSVILHTDTAMLPKRRKAWASWNYQLNNNKDADASVTYNMNILQGIDAEHTFCVTLNQKKEIEPSKILREFTYHHPVFSLQSCAAQQQRDLICGKHNTHFAGAYWHNGFHEDGVKSAIEVAKRFDCSLDAVVSN